MVSTRINSSSTYRQQPIPNYQGLPIPNYQGLPIPNYQGLPIPNYQGLSIPNYQGLPLLQPTPYKTKTTHLEHTYIQTDNLSKSWTKTEFSFSEN